MRRRPTTRLRLEMLEDRSVPSATDVVSMGFFNAYTPSMSADGQYVAFQSFHPDPLAGDVANVFLKNTQTGSVQLVSKTDSGEIPQGDSGSPAISADGNFVAFLSHAPNLVAGQTAGPTELFVWSRLTGLTREIGNADESSIRAESHGDESTKPFISADGRYVAYTYHNDIYLADLQSGTASLISVQLGGSSSGLSNSPSVSADGRYVAFESRSRDLVADDQSPFNTPEVYVCDRLLGTTEQVRIPDAILQTFATAGQTVGTEMPLISADGRSIAFSAFAQDGNAIAYGGWRPVDAFVQDLATGHTEMIPEPAGGSGFGYSNISSISEDGRFVAFSYDPHPPSDAVYFSETDEWYAVVYDRQLGSERVVSLPPTYVVGPYASPTMKEGRSPFGEDAPTYVVGPDSSPTPGVSDDGRFVAFESPTLHAADGDFFGTGIYMRDLNDPSVPVDAVGQVGDWDPRPTTNPAPDPFLPIPAITTPPVNPDPVDPVPVIIIPINPVIPPVSVGGTSPMSDAVPALSPGTSSNASLALSSGGNSAIFFAPDANASSTDIEILTSGSSIGPRKSGNQLPDTGRTNATPAATTAIGNDLITTRHSRDSFLSLDPSLTGTLAS